MALFRFASLALGACLTFGTAFAAQITLTGAAGFPNGRTTGDNPPNAIDGDLGTWTWTTNSFNVSEPSSLAISFDGTAVNHIRLWKSADGGGGENIKNLSILYTTDTNSDLSARSYSSVTGLSSGFFGNELFSASAVNSNGTVTGDIHESSLSGWASLTFDTVNATGVAIAFSNPSGTNFVHYRVAEFQAYTEEIVASPEPGTMLLLSCGLSAIVLAARRR